LSIKIASDNIVTLTDLLDDAGAYVNTATVAGKLFDVTASTTLATFTLTSSSTTGDYSGTLSSTDTDSLTAGKTYLLQITASTTASTLVKRQEHCAHYDN